MSTTSGGGTSTPAGKKIAILGYAPSVREAPWGDPSWELWGLNDQPWTMPRIDVLFELHEPSVIKVEGHWEKLAKLTIPIYMQDRFADIPTSVAYPLAEVVRRHQIPGTDRPYMTCSAALMLAQAVLLDPAPAQIAIVGVDMLMNEEFRAQRPSCEFWIGVAHGRGIPISVQPASGLLKTPVVYGWADTQVHVAKTQLNERSQWLQTKLNEAIAKEAAAKEERLQYVGAIADHTYHVERQML